MVKISNFLRKKIHDFVYQNKSGKKWRQLKVLKWFFCYVKVKFAHFKGDIRFFRCQIDLIRVFLYEKSKILILYWASRIRPICFTVHCLRFLLSSMQK